MENLRPLFLTCPLPMLLVAPDGTIKLASAGARNMFGHRLDAIEGRPVRTLLPRFAWQPDQNLGGKRTSDRPPKQTVRLVAPSGLPLVLDLRSYTLDIDGERHLLLSATDRADALRLHAETASVLESSPGAVLIVDHFGAIQFANDALCHLFGYPRDALLGKAVEFLVTERVRGSHPFDLDSVAMGCGHEPDHITQIGT